MRRAGGLAAFVVSIVSLGLATAAGADPVAAPAPPAWHRLEAGGAVGGTWGAAMLGLLVSVAATDRIALEAAASRLPGGIWRQAQLRVGLVRDRPTRRSLVAGLTHGSGGNPRDTPGIGAHGGVSLQQSLARHVDLRLDLQVVVPFRDGPDADPRMMIAVVWRGRAEPANRQRNTR